MRTGERLEETIELLPTGVADQPNFAAMDLELTIMFNKLSGQIAERCNILAAAKLAQENIAYIEWKSKIQTPLDDLLNKMNYVNRYIYEHATQFSCFTSKAEKLQAKQDAIQAYTIIQQIITEKDGTTAKIVEYNFNATIDQRNINLFKIHDNYLRNGVLLIVGGVILFAVAMSIIIGGPFILAAITTGVALASSTILMVTIISYATALISLAGSALLISQGGEKVLQICQDNYFRDNFSNTLSGFFHNDVKTLLPNNDVPAPASEATVECAP